MLCVDQIVCLQKDFTSRWHSEPISCTQSGYLALVCQQHSFNFQLWHEEDRARSPHADAAVIANVKRRIDRLNQQRNDAIENLDDWLFEELRKARISPADHATTNTETPGSAIDRLSIMALRIFHYEEQLHRPASDSSHFTRVHERLELCKLQHQELAQSLKELVSDIMEGRRRHRIYRQLKMYNDPSLNPYLYES